MNLFAQQIKFEDTEGLNLPSGQLITEGDEGESVAAAVAEVTEEEAGIAEDERAMDGLVEDEETLSEVQEVVENDAPKMEHTGLTPVGARLAKIVLARVVGKRHADKTLPKMEHFNSRSDARDATSFVQEGVSDALKSFWEALKAQFKKIWERIKSWYIKTFSAAKTLSERAKTVRDRAEGASATIDKKSFQFGQVKQLAIGGRLKDVSEFSRALGRVTAIVKEATDVPTEKQLEALENELDKFQADSTKEFGQSMGALQGIVRDGFASLGKHADAQHADSKVVESLGGGDKGDAEVTVTGVLPGDKQLAVVTAKQGSDTIKTLRMSRISFVNTKDKPREVSGDAEAVTLNASQIAQLCETIIEGADVIFDYEKAWKRTEKSPDLIIRKIDELVKDATDANKDDDNGKSSKERGIRGIASAVTGFVNRLSGMTAQISGYAMPVYAATLNWCEGSMRNYKK